MALLDISGSFKYLSFERNNRRYREVSGTLGIPGTVVVHRKPGAQRAVSAATGDDAGHLIGRRFGASGGAENLGSQNWVQNRCGSFKELENTWASLLKAGWTIEVCVQEIYRKDEDRPFTRHVEWLQCSPSGKKEFFEIDFANTHTIESREKQEVPPTVPQDNYASVIDMFTRRRLR